MATPAASYAGFAAIPFIPFIRRIGDRLEVEVPEPKATLFRGVLSLTCFGLSLLILLTGKPPEELTIIGVSICLFFIPGCICLWNHSFRCTWLVVGPQKWRAVSGWMMSAPDPDRFVKGPFITHQKDGLVKDFISLTVTENASQGLLFESTSGSFYFNPDKLQKLWTFEKACLAGKVEDFMNEMKGHIRHDLDGSIELKTWSQHDVDYSTLPKSLRPVDSVGGFKTHIRRTGNRLDVIADRNVGVILWAAVTLSISVLLIKTLILRTTGKVLFLISLFYVLIACLVSIMVILTQVSGKWLVVERYTWRLTSFWLRYPNIERDMARSQNWSDKELCGAFVAEVPLPNGDTGTTNYFEYFSLRVKDIAGADPNVIHILRTTRDEMQWLAEEVDKHIKMIKEHPFPAKAVSCSIPLEHVSTWYCYIWWLKWPLKMLSVWGVTLWATRPTRASTKGPDRTEPQRRGGARGFVCLSCHVLPLSLRPARAKKDSEALAWPLTEH
ncbi:hypothetical protein Vretimale_11073 [Volvox reticuliferus]|uniref:Uncharacterized protein n=1 Tax=Volvox reticuliferus TaxID=1737510 RepID=A0A8J4CMR9_9CHLO|nr:hypothetical protein Vretifemale_12750 [Volvox reticuliferus]GIM06774.1 hypothetical protein Vretimale_11073 [Volvox reticuliferus]